MAGAPPTRLVSMLALLCLAATATAAAGAGHHHHIETQRLRDLRARVTEMPGEMIGGIKRVFLPPGELDDLRGSRATRAGRVVADGMQGPRPLGRGRGLLGGAGGSFRREGSLADMMVDIERALTNETERIAPPGDLRAMFDLGEEEHLELLRAYGYSLGVMERWGQKTWREYIDESCVDGFYEPYFIFPTRFTGPIYTYSLGECLYKQVPDITYLPITYEVHFDKYNGLRLGADVPEGYLYQEPLVTYFPLLDCVAPSFEIEPTELIHAYLQTPIKVNKFCIFLFGEEKLKGGREFLRKFGDERDCLPDGCDQLKEHLVEDLGLPEALVDPPWLDFDVPSKEEKAEEKKEGVVEFAEAFAEFNKRIAESKGAARPTWLRAAMPGLADLPPWLSESSRLPRFLDPAGLTDPNT